jgi:hypothetical protein
VTVEADLERLFDGSHVGGVSRLSSDSYDFDGPDGVVH